MPSLPEQPKPETVKDQYLFLAEQFGRKILGNELTPMSATPIAPSITDGLVVLSQYNSKVRGWQYLSWTKFVIPLEGIEETVSQDADPDLYENDFSKYTLDLVSGYLDTTHSVRMQAFASPSPKRNIIIDFKSSNMRSWDAQATVSTLPGRLKS